MASRPLEFTRGLLARIFPPKAKAEILGPFSRRLQFMSDLHLEICQQYAAFDFPATAPFLVLGGDIGRLVDYDGYLAFLVRQATRYKRVFLVLGNHEFYGMSFDEGLERAQQLVCEPELAGKVTLLQQSRYELDLTDAEGGLRVVILGCVLWSRIAAESAETIGMTVSDFKQIRGWTVVSHNDAHTADVKWLRTEMERMRCEETGEKNVVIVVVTHHAPRRQPPQVGVCHGSAVQAWRCGRGLQPDQILGLWSYALDYGSYCRHWGAPREQPARLRLPWEHASDRSRSRRPCAGAYL